jgi:hypothetical protein
VIELCFVDDRIFGLTQRSVLISEQEETMNRRRAA